MGLFGKRKARKAAEAKAEATQSGKWDNPTQTKKPAYKQKGFDAGEGTNRGPNMKTGDDNYTPPARKTTEKREPNKTVSLETKKPKAINTDTETPSLKSRTDVKPPPRKKRVTAGQKRQAELDAYKKKKAEAEAKNTKPTTTTTTTTTKPESSKTNVKNKEKTKSSGYATNYSKNELASDNSDKRKTSYKNKKAAEESGATTYEHWNPKTRKYTKTATSHHTKSKNYKKPK